MTEVVIEIERADNGYILRKTRGWTLHDTLVFKTLDEVYEWLKNHMVRD